MGMVAAALFAWAWYRFAAYLLWPLALLFWLVVRR